MILRSVAVLLFVAGTVVLLSGLTLLGRAPALWSWAMVIGATVAGWALMIMLFARFRRRIPYWI